MPVVVDEHTGNELGIGYGRFRHRSVGDRGRGGGALRMAVRCASRARARGRPATSATRRHLPLLEPPQHDVADAEEQKHQPDAVGRPVLEQRKTGEAQPDRAHDHAFAQIRPRGVLAYGAHLLGRGGRTGGDLRGDVGRNRGGRSPVATAAIASLGPTTPRSASFSIVSFCMRALRIR